MRPKLGSRLPVSGSPLAPFTTLPWASRIAVVFLALLGLRRCASDAESSSLIPREQPT